MSFELPALPSFQSNIPQQIAAMPSPLEQYGKMLQLKALSGQIGQQQQMQPLQVQQAQQSVQAATLQNQKTQQEMDSQKALQKAIAAGELGKYAGVATPDGSGFDAGAAYQHLLTNHPEILPQDAGGVVQSMQTIGKNTAEIAKDTSQAGEARMAIRAKALSAVANKMGSIEDAFQSDPEKAGPAALSAFKQDLIQNPTAYQGMTKDELGHLYATPPDLAHIKAVDGLLGLEGQVTDFHKSQADATKAELGITSPSASQVSTFTGKTIPSFGALRPEQKQAFISEAQNARTVDELNKVTERADATDKAEQMHRDSLAQTEVLKGQTFANQGLVANDKTWTDPQHGYLQTLSQAKLGKAAIKAGADGNGLLTSLEPTMAVLGMNSFAGVHRISPAEATAAGAPGGWAERFTAWADKSAAGKLSPQLAKEGNQLFDQLIDSKYDASLQTSAMHSQGYNIPANKMPVMDREGNVTTLDKAPKPKPSEQTSAAAVTKTYQGHTYVQQPDKTWKLQ